MEYICHRINSAQMLTIIPEQFGAEIDLRDGTDGRLYLSHDPFVPGPDFEEFLEAYHHGTLILNIKSERIEHRVLDLLEQYGVKRYFFLDSSFPMIYLLSSEGIQDIAIRFSEYERMDTLRQMAGKAGWVWADCFTRCVLTPENYAQLRELGYRICLVSPELQGRPEDIPSHAVYLRDNGLIPDAICTKYHQIALWQKYFA